MIHSTVMENTLTSTKISMMFKKTALEICALCIRRKGNCLSRECRGRKQKKKKKEKGENMNLVCEVCLFWFPPLMSFQCSG